jgi:Peptidase_C39 like family
MRAIRLFLCTTFFILVLIPVPQAVQAAEFPDDIFVELAPETSPQGILLPVPLIPQPTDTSCGPTSFIMAWDTVHPDQPLSLDVAIRTALRNRWLFDWDPQQVYMSPEHLGQLAAFYAGRGGYPMPESGVIDLSAKDDTPALAFLRQQLSQGKPVIVDAMEIFFKIHSGSHFLVVTGISANNTFITVNDPFGYLSPTTHKARRATLPWDVFKFLWQHNGDPGGQGFYLIVN